MLDALRAVQLARGLRGVVVSPSSWVPGTSAPGSRRIPQWLFLGALFRDVLLRDRAPAAAASGARSVALLRRAVLSAATALALVGGLWSTVQYSKNGRAVSAARELGTVMPSAAELPSAETLHRLETLRAHLGRLSSWRRWWFYKGTGLYRELRQIYMDRFDRILLGPARASVLRSLDSLPDAPNATAQYGRAYQLLKAYLMTTSHPERMSPSFLVPVLKDRWLNGRQIDPERTEVRPVRNRRTCDQTASCRKHETTWSLTMPAACMNA